MKTSVWVCGLGAMLAVAAGCAKDKPADSPASVNGSWSTSGNNGSASNGTMPPPYCGPQPCPPGSNGSGTPPPATTGTAMPPPANTGATAGMGNPADVINNLISMGASMIGAAGAAVGADPVDLGLKGLAQQQAPGMKPDGQAIKVTLGPGQHGEGQIMMQPGKCYTVLAFGNLGVQSVAIRLVPPPPLPPQVLFEGVTNGPTATIGAKDSCIRSPSPLAAPLKVDIEMKAGQGQVGVQAFSK
jgi:hypothetical protein